MGSLWDNERKGQPYRSCKGAILFCSFWMADPRFRIMTFSEAPRRESLGSPPFQWYLLEHASASRCRITAGICRCGTNEAWKSLISQVNQLLDDRIIVSVCWFQMKDICWTLWGIGYRYIAASPYWSHSSSVPVLFLILSPLPHLHLPYNTVLQPHPPMHYMNQSTGIKVIEGLYFHLWKED